MSQKLSETNTDEGSAEAFGASGEGVSPGDSRELDLEKIARGVSLILEGIGEDAERAGLRRTPSRASKASCSTRRGRLLKSCLSER